jgi:hypothetical protein
MRLGPYTKILEQKVDGRPVAYHVTQTMRYARRPIDFEGEPPSIEFDGTIGLPEGYRMAWHEPTGEDPGRPATNLTDPKMILDRDLELLRWAIDVVGDGDPELIPRLWVIGDALAQPALNLGVVAETLKHRPGYSQRTLERHRKKIREWGRVLPSQGADWVTCLDALARFPQLVTFVARLK